MSLWGRTFSSVREQFTEEQWPRFSAVRRFVDEEVVPVAGPYWERAEICWPLVRRQAGITLAEVRVPGENRLPGARSFTGTRRVLATTRSTCAWAALGHATAAYDTALRYVLERRQFGQPLASFQVIQQRLVAMLADLTAIAAEARDLLGGNGILLDYQVMRHMADLEAIHTLEGTETMQTLIVGRAIAGISVFT